MAEVREGGIGGRERENERVALTGGGRKSCDNLGESIAGRGTPRAKALIEQA